MSRSDCKPLDTRSRLRLKCVRQTRRFVVVVGVVDLGSKEGRPGVSIGQKLVDIVDRLAVGNMASKVVAVMVMVAVTDS